MKQERRDPGWLNIFAGLSGLVLLVLALMLVLSARMTGEPDGDSDTVLDTESAIDITSDGVASGSATTQTVPPQPNPFALFQDGERIVVQFDNGLSAAGAVEIGDGVLVIRDPLGEPIDLSDAAALVKEDGRALALSEGGLAAAPSAPIPAEPVPTEVAPPVVSAAPRLQPSVSLPVNATQGGVSVSAVLDRYPVGTLFAATLQSGEEVIAMKQNRIKLVQVDQATGAVSKTIVPPWMIVEIQPVL